MELGTATEAAPSACKRTAETKWRLHIRHNKEKHISIIILIIKNSKDFTYLCWLWVTKIDNACLENPPGELRKGKYRIRKPKLAFREIIATETSIDCISLNRNKKNCALLAFGIWIETPKYLESSEWLLPFCFWLRSIKKPAPVLKNVLRLPSFLFAWLRSLMPKIPLRLLNAVFCWLPPAPPSKQI